MCIRDSIIAPFPPLSGPLWVGMTVSVSMRYKEGKKAMKSLLGGMASFRLATFLSVLIIPVVSFFRPIFGVGSVSYTHLQERTGNLRRTGTQTPHHG